MTTIAPRTTCSFCRLEQPVDPALFRKVQGYRDVIDRHVESAQIAHEAQEEMQAARSSGGSGLIVAVGTVVGSAIVIRLVHWSLPVGIGAGVLLAVATFGGVPIYLAWDRRRRMRALELPEELGACKVRCPNCGAEVEFRMGEVTNRCGHCGSTLLPPEEARAEGLRAARKMLGGK